MHLALIILASFWAWEFMYHYVPKLPDYLSHFLVPVIVFGASLLPAVILLPLAVSSVIGWLHRLTQWVTPPRPLVQPTRKRAKLPPLP